MLEDQSSNNHSNRDKVSMLVKAVEIQVVNLRELRVEILKVLKLRFGETVIIKTHLIKQIPHILAQI